MLRIQYTIHNISSFLGCLSVALKEMATTFYLSSIKYYNFCVLWVHSSARLHTTTTTTLSSMQLEILCWCAFILMHTKKERVYKSRCECVFVYKKIKNKYRINAHEKKKHEKKMHLNEHEYILECFAAEILILTSTDSESPACRWKKIMPFENWREWEKKNYAPKSLTIATISAAPQTRIEISVINSKSNFNSFIIQKLSHQLNRASLVALNRQLLLSISCIFYFTRKKYHENVHHNLEFLLVFKRFWFYLLDMMKM